MWCDTLCIISGSEDVVGDTGDDTTGTGKLTCGTNDSVGTMGIGNDIVGTNGSGDGIESVTIGAGVGIV